MERTLQQKPRQWDNSEPVAEMLLASVVFLDKVSQSRSQREVTGDQSIQKGSSGDTGPVRSWEECQAVQERDSQLGQGID